MFSTLSKKFGSDKDYAPRVAILAMRQRVLDGTLYDKLKYDFHEERTDAGEYIKLADRKPSVRYNLSKIVVDDSVSLLFGEARFPKIVCEDRASAEELKQIVDETGLDDVMQEAAFRGSIGSVAVWMRVLENRLFFDVMDTLYLTPTWRPEAPDTLQSVTEQYKVRGDALKAIGYDIPDSDAGVQFWFRRVWDDQNETWYLPWKVNPRPGDPGPQIDEAKSVNHRLGFVPIVWIKNLPGGDAIDGLCTFKPAIETQIEMEYQLSQAGRGLKYSSDPTLLIKDPASEEGAPVIKGGSNALVVDEKGDAKLLEISGRASEAVIKYVETLRQMALESIHGNRSSADKLAMAQSGRALEILHQPLIWLADKLRTSYGTRALLPLVKMAIAARRVYPLRLNNRDMIQFPTDLRVSLNWPDWFHPTMTDKAQEGERVIRLYSGGLLSRETGLGVIQDNNGFPDIEAEASRIDADTAAKDARAIKMGAAVTATDPLTT